MNESGYSLSDIQAVTKGEEGFGGNWMLVLFFLLIYGGGGFGINRANPATTEDLANGFNFNSLQEKTNDILGAIAGVNQNLSNSICQLGYQDLQHTNAIQSQLADCCCTTQRAIDGVKFDMANYAAATNANVTAGIQKVLDKMCEDKEAALTARISQLEMQNALCNVVKYPTYATTCNPFFGGGNCAY